MLSKGCGEAPKRPPTFSKGRNPRRGIHYFGDVELVELAEFAAAPELVHCIRTFQLQLRESRMTLRSLPYWALAVATTLGCL